MIQPQVLLRLPCYDFTLIICPTLGGWLLKGYPTDFGCYNSHGVTGGVYKARERIHRGMLIRDYSRFRLRAGELQPRVRTENGFRDLLALASSRLVVTVHCSTCVAQVVKGMMIYITTYLRSVTGSLTRVPNLMLATSNKGCARCGT